MQRLAVIAAVLMSAAPVWAVDLPLRKAGLWELKMTFVGRGMPPQTMKHCTDAATDKLMNANFGGSNEQNCSKQDMTHEGGNIVVDSVCTFGGVTVNSHAVISGSFDSAYKVDVASTRSGGAPGTPAAGASHMIIDAKWTGACAAGQKPGDVIMANGMSMNVLDMQKMRGAPAGGMRPPPPR